MDYLYLLPNDVLQIIIRKVKKITSTKEDLKEKRKEKAIGETK